MPEVDLPSLKSNPRFLQLTPQEKAEFLSAASPKFTALSKQEQLQVIAAFPKSPGTSANTGGASASWGAPPPPPRRNWADVAGQYGGYAGGMAGSVIGGLPSVGVGAVPGATIGGMAGQTGGRALQARFGNRPVPATAGAAVQDVEWEGIKQGALQVVNDAVFSPAMKAVAGLRTVKPGEELIIGGVKMPRTVGQAYGKLGGLTQQAEHYLSGTWLGGALRRVGQAQEQASRVIMAKLAKVQDALPETLSFNWGAAKIATQNTATPIYEALKDVETASAGKVAKDILEDESLPLSGRAKIALRKIAADPDDALAVELGYKNAEEAVRKVGQKAFDLTKAQGGIGGIRAEDSMQAVQELKALAFRATRKNDQRLLTDAMKRLDEAVESHFGPEQIAAKKQADYLWHRSYIMEKIESTLREKMELAAGDPKNAATLFPDQFSELVKELTSQVAKKGAGGAIEKSIPALDILFDAPADRKAMVELSSFLSGKGRALLGGKGGMSEYIARLAAMLPVLHAPVAAMFGHETQAAISGATLAGLYGLSNLLANEGAPRLLRKYLTAPTLAAAQALLPQIGRLAAGAYQEYREEKKDQETATMKGNLE